MPPKLEKTIKPQVYALLIEFMDSAFLSIQYAYSLEEAFLMAKLEFEKQNKRLGLAPLSSLLGAKIGLFVTKKYEDLIYARPNFPKVKMQEVKDAFNELNAPIEKYSLHPIPMGKKSSPKMPQVLTKKNALMKEIVEKKDVEKFNQNKSTFTKAEQSYLEEKIKKDSTS